MKTALLFLLAFLACKARCASSAPAEGGGFAGVGIDYKKPQELSASFFNPFRIQSASDSAMQKKDSATVTNDVVAGALAHRGVSGIIYTRQGGGSEVIIGDQVFGVGDELTFPDEGKDDPVPLVSGASVVLRGVGAGNLAFDVSPEGEPVRRMTYSLRGFWRP